MVIVIIGMLVGLLLPAVQFLRFVMEQPIRICYGYYDSDYLGVDGKDYYTAFLLGKNHVGMRAEDLLSVTRWLESLDETGNVECFARFTNFS